MLPRIRWSKSYHSTRPLPGNQTVLLQQLWSEYPYLEMQTPVDSEWVLPCHSRRKGNKNGEVWEKLARISHQIWHEPWRAQSHIMKRVFSPLFFSILRTSLCRSTQHGFYCASRLPEPSNSIVPYMSTWTVWHYFFKPAKSSPFFKQWFLFPWEVLEFARHLQF